MIAAPSEQPQRFTAEQILEALARLERVGIVPNTARVKTLLALSDERDAATFLKSLPTAVQESRALPLR